MIAGYIGSGNRFAQALGRFGVAYADQTQKDWQELRKKKGTGNREQGSGRGKSR